LILIDTNVLVYAINIDAPQHAASRALLDAVRDKKIDGVIVTQVLLEFYAIVTDQRRTDQPLVPDTAWQQINILRTFLPLLVCAESLLDTLKQLGTDIKGPDIFDTHLAAQMKSLGISVLCTYSKKDFRRYEGVITKLPEELLDET
jgi:uncharacterized protein